MSHTMHCCSMRTAPPRCLKLVQKRHLPSWKPSSLELLESILQSRSLMARRCSHDSKANGFVRLLRRITELCVWPPGVICVPVLILCSCLISLFTRSGKLQETAGTSYDCAAFIEIKSSEGHLGTNHCQAPVDAIVSGSCSPIDSCFLVHYKFNYKKHATLEIPRGVQAASSLAPPLAPGLSPPGCPHPPRLVQPPAKAKTPHHTPTLSLVGPICSLLSFCLVPPAMGLMRIRCLTWAS